MRSIQLSAVLLVAGCVAGAQFVASSSNFSMDKDGNFAGTVNFQPAGGMAPAVIGVPYSAEDAHEREQVLANGTRIRSTTMTRKVWRDSQGRSRSERPVIMSPNRPAKSPVIVEISDPVEGVLYVLEESTQVAHRIKASPLPSRVGQGATQFRPMPSSEPLGTRLIEGVMAEGYRHTNVIPEGKVGNDRPLTTTNEIWYSNELRMVVLSKSDDPRNGINQMMVKNISRIEPDPALFRVPAGYTVVDEAGPFSIKFGSKQ